VLRVGAGHEASDQRHLGSSLPTIAHAVSHSRRMSWGTSTLDHCGPLRRRPRSSFPCAGHHDAHLGRAIVHVQAQRDRAAEYRDRWLRDLRRSAPPRSGPYRAVRLRRPARQPLSQYMPAVDRTPTNERALRSTPARPQRRDPARNDGTARVQLGERHADAIAHCGRQIAPSAEYGMAVRPSPCTRSVVFCARPIG